MKKNQATFLPKRTHVERRLERLAQSHEVAQAFGHFLVVHVHEPVVDPVLAELFVVERFRLGDFVGVVRER